MKQLKLISSVAGVVAVAGLLATSSLGDIEGTDHDFTSKSWNNTGELCKPCHTPHNSSMESNAGPLWNRALTTATFTLHEGEQGTVDDFDRNTILCLGCHDGTIAVDSFGGNGNGGTEYIDGSELLGTDLSNDHPIGKQAIYANFPWLQDPSIWEDRAVGKGMRLQNWGDDGLGNPLKVVGCSTCHEPHDRNGVKEDFLWLSNAGSAVCQLCHLK